MNSMFDRFTDRAKKAMAAAREEEDRLESGYLGPEHILLGVLREGSGLGCATLQGLLGSLDGLTAEIEKLSVPALKASASKPSPGQPVPITTQAKHALEMALEEAAALKHGYVGTEHLLLGLLRDPDGVAARALKNQGLTLEQVRREVIHRLPHALGMD
jgi:ATP-dependent Clp protease ATP-binding subunit ClpC